MKPGTILDANGNPLAGPPAASDNSGVPDAVHALVELRLKTELDRMKEANTAELKVLARTHENKWRFVALLSVAFGVFSWFVAPQQIQEWIKEAVQQKMSEPMIRDAVDVAMREKAGVYIDEKLTPLREQTDALAATIAQLDTDISNKQNQLQTDQDLIRRQLRLPQLATDAKVGSLEAFNELRYTAQGTDSLAPSAKAALQDIELYFDLDRAQIFFISWVDRISRQDPGWSVEELLLELKRQDPQERAAVVNSLSGLAANGSTIAQHLYEALQSEVNLRVVARLTRALALATKQEFRPLDIAAVDAWWNLHKKDPRFQSPYGPFFEAQALLSKPNIDNQKVLDLLDQTISAQRDAVFARSQKAGLLILHGKLTEAQQELEEIAKQRPDFRWLLFWRSLLSLKQGKEDEAVTSLNAALARSPALEENAKLIPEFIALLTNPKVALPSRQFNK